MACLSWEVVVERTSTQACPGWEPSAHLHHWLYLPLPLCGRGWGAC